MCFFCVNLLGCDDVEKGYSSYKDTRKISFWECPPSNDLVSCDPNIEVLSKQQGSGNLAGVPVFSSRPHAEGMRLCSSLKFDLCFIKKGFDFFGFFLGMLKTFPDSSDFTGLFLGGADRFGEGSGELLASGND